MRKKEESLFEEMTVPGFISEDEERLWVSGRSSREDILTSEGLNVEPAFDWRGFFRVPDRNLQEDEP